MTNKIVQEDYRTVDAAGNVVIKTRDLITRQVTDYYHGYNSVTHYHMIEL